MRAVLLKNEELSKIKSELVKRICKFGPILQKEKAPGAEASGAFKQDLSKGLSKPGKTKRPPVGDPGAFSKKEKVYEKP